MGSTRADWRQQARGPSHGRLRGYRRVKVARGEVADYQRVRVPGLRPARAERHPEGREVNVARTPPADERHADLTFAINDAFKHARRQLQDQRRMQGQVKHHEDQPIGTVKNLDASGEFGFLEATDGHAVYFHRNSVLDGAFSRLAVGAHVTFAEEMGGKGPQASTVRLLGKHSLRS